MCNRWNGSSKCGPVGEAPGLIEDFIQLYRLCHFSGAKQLHASAWCPAASSATHAAETQARPQSHSRSCSYTRARMSDPLLSLSGTLKQREWDVVASARKAKEEEELRVFEEKDCNVVNLVRRHCSQRSAVINSDYIVELLKIDWKHSWRTYGIWILVLLYQQMNERYLVGNIYIYFIISICIGMCFAEIVVGVHF